MPNRTTISIAVVRAAIIAAVVILGPTADYATAHEGHNHPPAAGQAETNTDEALVFLIRRVAANPADTIAISKVAALRLERARQSSAHEEFDAAAAAFQSLLNLRPDSTTARMGLGYTLIGRHRFAEALTLARDVAERLHGEPQAWALLGDAHFALGHYAEADACYRRLQELGITVESLSRAAQIDAVRGRIDEAAQKLNDAFEAGQLLDAPPTTLAWCRMMLGELYAAHGQPGPARAAYLQALRWNPTDAIATLRLAEMEAADGSPAAAIHMLRPLAESADRPAAWIAMGDFLAAAGEADEARHWFEKAEADMLADLAAGDVGHLRELVEYWLAHGGDAARAVELALQDVRDVRQDVGAYETAAWALHKASRHAEAADMMAMALRSGAATQRMRERAAAIRAALPRPQVHVAMVPASPLAAETSNTPPAGQGG